MSADELPYVRAHILILDAEIKALQSVAALHASIDWINERLAVTSHQRDLLIVEVKTWLNRHNK